MSTTLTEVLNCPQGKIQGLQFSAHQRFLRIPYVEAERFALPEKLVSWEGVLDATQKPEQPYQKVMPFVSGSTPESEDCLFLNVYTPKADNKKRAVMVWFYGGGFTQGSAYNALYNGQHLAEQCDVVVVTVNYRIGLLGYGYFDHLNNDDFSSPLNLGLHDQLGALEWVRDSIRSFGGDPDLVTVFGQSAGAMSICAMLAAPRAKGLFKRAICQSGGDVLISNRDTNAHVSDMALSKLDVSSNNLAELKTMDAKVMSKGPDGLLHLSYETELLPEKPLDVLLQGQAHHVDLMMGYTRHEVATPLIKKKLKWLIPIIKMFTTLDIQASYDEIKDMPLLASKLKSNMEEVIAFYKGYYTKLGKRGSEEAICAAILTDAIFARPARNFLSAHSMHRNSTGNSTYAYRFEWGLSILGTTGISFHAADVPFPFASLEALKPSLKVIAGLGAKDYQLANNMMQSWANFAKTGDPNHGGIPEWQQYSKKQPGFMCFDRESQFKADERQEVFDFWDGFLGEFESSTLP